MKKIKRIFYHLLRDSDGDYGVSQQVIIQHWKGEEINK